MTTINKEKVKESMLLVEKFPNFVVYTDRVRVLASLLTYDL